MSLPCLKAAMTEEIWTLHRCLKISSNNWIFNVWYSIVVKKNFDMHIEIFINEMIWFLGLFQDNLERRRVDSGIDWTRLVRNWRLPMLGDREGVSTPFSLFFVCFKFYSLKKEKSSSLFLFCSLLFPYFFFIKNVYWFSSFSFLYFSHGWRSWAGGFGKWGGAFQGWGSGSGVKRWVT